MENHSIKILLSNFLATKPVTEYQLMKASVSVLNHSKNSK